MPDNKRVALEALSVFFPLRDLQSPVNDWALSFLIGINFLTSSARLNALHIMRGSNSLKIEQFFPPQNRPLQHPLHLQGLKQMRERHFYLCKDFYLAYHKWEDYPFGSVQKTVYLT